MGDEDKQFDATPQKLDRARREGQVVKSRDFSMAIFMLVVFASVFGLAPFIWEQIVTVFTLLYEQIPNAHLEDINYMYIFLVSVKGILLILFPIFAIAWLVAVLADFVQVGPLVAIAPLMPKLDKLNPTKYFKNIMSIKTLFELFKNIAKVIILGYIGWSVYNEHIEHIMMLAQVDNNFAVLKEFGELITQFIFKACIAFLVIAAADYGVTKWKFLQDQKMSFKEIKDEYKNSEGDPNVKAQLRQRRMQMLQQGAMDAVPTADFVVTNPTHVACALKYVAEEMDSPMLIAKGTELIAKKIIDIAKEHNVPVIENPPVARALFRMVDINQSIPPELYKAVAEILMFVYKMKNPTNKRPRN